MRKVRVARVSEIPDGEVLPVDADGVDVLLSKIDGQVYAIDAVCNHQNGALENGEVEGRMITCPIHQAIFDLTCGKVSPDTPWAADQTCFTVTIEGDEVFVTIE